MATVCVECWLDLRCVFQQTLLRVPESTSFRELFTKEVALKLASRDYLEESLTVSVSPTGKEELKTICRPANLTSSKTWRLVYYS